MSRPYDKLMKDAECNSYALAEEIYQLGRADAINEYKKKIEFEYKWLLDCKVFEPNVDIAFNTLMSYAEQIKEQNNGQRNSKAD